MASDKTFLLFGPRVSEAMKQTLREQLGYEEIPTDFGPFGSGAVHCELFPINKEERAGKTQEELDQRFRDISAKLNDAHVIVVSSTGEMPHVADSVECVKDAIEGLKVCHVGKITLAMPSTAYERQDRSFEEQGRFCSVKSESFARDLKWRGVNDVLTYAPHSQATMDFWSNAFGEENYHPLSTDALFAENIRQHCPDSTQLVIGAPDGADKPNDQGQARARQLAEAVCAEPQLFKIGKAHVDASETKITSFEGDVAGKDCVVVDDMSDGGSTLINAAKALKARGAKSVATYITHAICSGNSLHKLASTPEIDRVVMTDSIPEIVGKREALEPTLQDKVEVLSLGHQLAQSLQQIIAREKPEATINGDLNATGSQHIQR